MANEVATEKQIAFVTELMNSRLNTYRITRTGDITREAEERTRAKQGGYVYTVRHTHYLEEGDVYAAFLQHMLDNGLVAKLTKAGASKVINVLKDYSIGARDDMRLIGERAADLLPKMFDAFMTTYNTAPETETEADAPLAPEQYEAAINTLLSDRESAEAKALRNRRYHAASERTRRQPMALDEIQRYVGTKNEIVFHYSREHERVGEIGKFMDEFNWPSTHTTYILYRVTPEYQQELNEAYGYGGG